MPHDSYHGYDRRALGRRVHHLSQDERIQVSCERCGKTRVYGWETLRAFRRDCPLAWLEEMLNPSCYDLVKGMPAGCVREVVWLDPAPHLVAEDVGCSDEG